jgi:hypothetical protein
MGKTEKWLISDPVKEEEMSQIGSRITVCELLREIYRRTDDPEIKMRCRVGAAIAKSMAARITKYEGRGWGREQYIWNINRHQEAERYKK